MPLVTIETCTADSSPDTATPDAAARLPWQTPRVISGSAAFEVVAAEGLGSLLDHHFFVGS